jgi:phosphoglycolate phosphatase-like HAD superfamily hydrolase
MLETLEELRKRSKPGVGIVTGRPRSDCMQFLRDNNIEHIFDVMYCMEDGPSKPDPFPVKRVCELLVGVEPSEFVVLVGDTPDDIKAATSAGCRAVGVTTPEAVAACEAKGEPHTAAKLSVIMKERGADIVLLPGFAQLVAMFHDP